MKKRIKKYEFTITLEEVRDTDPRWDAVMSLRGVRRMILAKGYDAEDAAEQIAQALTNIVKRCQELENNNDGN